VSTRARGQIKRENDMFLKKKKILETDNAALKERLAAETRQINEIEAKRSRAIDAAERLADKIINNRFSVSGNSRHARKIDKS
jgi:hypothetical protein